MEINHAFFVFISFKFNTLRSSNNNIGQKTHSKYRKNPMVDYLVPFRYVQFVPLSLLSLHLPL